MEEGLSDQSALKKEIKEDPIEMNSLAYNHKRTQRFEQLKQYL